MIPDKFNMVDMGGVDLIMMQGEAVPGLYDKLMAAISNCQYQCLYNWLFDGVLIPPTYVQLEDIDGEVFLNEGVSVTSDDVIHIYSVEPGPVEPEIIPLLAEENGVYNVPAGKDGFNPVTVDVPSYTPVIEALSVTENGTYPVPSGVDGYSPVTVNVPGSGAGVWHDSFSVNWDFSNPVNTRGQTRYTNSGLIYSLDGWQLQGGTLDIVAGGIKLSRYSSGTAGYFMQRYKSTPTSAFVGKQMTLSAIIDGELGYISNTITSGAGSKLNMTVSGITVRAYYYGAQGEIAVTFDIGTDSVNKLIQAVKLEAGATQTLATQIGNVWVLNQQMDSNTELIKIGEDLVYNS